MKYDLAVIIPGRNEEFMARTVEGVLKNRRGKTQIIVGMDEVWANPPVEDHEDVVIFHSPISLGQRAMTNKCVALSNAKYIMKLDSHCIVSEGFDVALIEAFNKLGDNIVQVPILYNLHAFDWVCPKCNNRTYQGPTLKKCLKEGCDGVPKREMVWKPRMNRKSEFYRFDETLHFQYHSQRKKQVDPNEKYPETMSIQGSCFVVSFKNYIGWDICEEEFGSWGNQGSEVACKTWLSGARLITNRNCWYSHLFRTQGQDFSFPYPQSGRQVEHAREYSRELFIKNKWDKQIHPLSWLLEKFNPLPSWHEPVGKEMLNKVNEEGKKFNKQPTKGIIYYTDNKVNIKLGHKCRELIKKSGLPITSVSLKPMDFGDNTVLKLERGYLAYHKQILTALEKSTADIIYFCEHDVMYHKSHFDFTPTKKDVYYYNINFWRVRSNDGFAIHYDTEQVNLICGYRELLLNHYKEKVKRIEESGFNMRMGFEPGCNRRKERIDNFKAERYQSAYPCLDIRHDTNLTSSRWSPKQFRDQRNCQGWKETTIKNIDGWKYEEL